MSPSRGFKFEPQTRSNKSYSAERDILCNWVQQHYETYGEILER